MSAEEHYEKIKKQFPNFKLIRGNEIYLCRNGLNANNYTKETDRYYHFCLWARDLVGAKQIMEISTRAWMRSYIARGMRRVPTYYQDLFDIIGKNPGHVLGGTACLGGALPTQILRAQSNPDLLPKIEIWIQQMDKLFGHGNFYLEMQPSKNKEQIYVNKELFKYSQYFNIPYIITTDAHYLNKEDRKIHKAYLNAQNGDREVDEFYATTYLMDTEELESFFPYFTKEQLQQAYINIQVIKNKCEDFSLKKPLRMPELKWRDNDVIMGYKERLYLYDKIPMLKTFLKSPYISDQKLVEAILSGIERHSDLQCEEAYNELNLNLKMTWNSSEVNNARWSAYFLNLQKIIDVCWEAGSLVGPSRGSGGGFLLLYALDIIQMNCLREKTPMFPWRFLNPSRVSPLDIDVDIEGSRRKLVLNALKNYFGFDRVSNVATFGTEKSKSAILTCARGLGIDVDIAQYISSLIPADRGQLRSLHECYYGNEEKGYSPVKQFIIEMNNNPDLWEMAKKIEGLVCRLGEHAGGVCLVDEPFTESTALMRAPNGDIITQFELHTIEKMSLIKMDLLSVEALDKIHNCLDLLSEAGYIEIEKDLRSTYEKVIGIYNLERNDPNMWNMIWNHKITSLFQMERDSGINGIAIAKPKSVEELAVLNSVIRLMPSEKNAEQPLNIWGKYRRNINIWYDEMRQYGLTEEEIQWLSSHKAITDGICESQEGLMQLVQEEYLGGNDLTFADSTRKAIAKKQGKLFEECQEKFYKNAEEKGCSNRLVHYVWDVLLKVQRGYSFCRAHCHAYSLIALQEMNLAYKYPIIFWNCACLINDAGGDEKEEEEEIETLSNEEIYDEMEDFGTNDEENEEDEDEEITPEKKKKKTATTNYDKIATAIGKMRMSGITVEPPDINKSTYTFSPDADLNIIRYGLSGITRVGEDLVKSIIAARPYSSIEDFLAKVKINKVQMINLIKSGAFDSFGDRIEIMHHYVDLISDTKKRVTLQNMKMLIEFKLLPPELDFHCRVYNYTKYLKKMKLDSLYYGLDNIAFNFFSKNFDIDILEPAETESGFKLSQAKWEKIYKKFMDEVRPYVKAHHDELLNAINTRLTADVWNKYCLGSLSKWEMDSVSFYSHEHELANVNLSLYGIDDFFKLNPQAEVERVIPIKGKQVPLFKLHRIAGVVLAKDKAKKTITLLTLSGVVQVKIYGAFEAYDRQISERGPDGRKHVIEKSLFSRGNKIIVTGIRTEESFLAKVYKSTPWHRVEQITDIIDGKLIIKSERAGEG